MDIDVREIRRGQTRSKIYIRLPINLLCRTDIYAASEFDLSLE